MNGLLLLVLSSIGSPQEGGMAEGKKNIEKNYGLIDSKQDCLS